MLLSHIAPAYPADEEARETAVIASGLLYPEIGLRLHDIVSRARSSLHTDMAALTIITGETQVLIAADGIGTGTTERSTSFCGHSILNPHHVMIVPDATLDRRFAGNPNVTDTPHIRFYAGAPLVSASGHALGTLCVFDPEPRTGISLREMEELRQLASKVMAFAKRA